MMGTSIYHAPVPVLDPSALISKVRASPDPTEVLSQLSTLISTIGSYPPLIFRPRAIISFASAR